MKIPGILENHIQNLRAAFQLLGDQALSSSSFSLLDSGLSKGFPSTWNKTQNPYSADKSA